MSDFGSEPDSSEDEGAAMETAVAAPTPPAPNIGGSRSIRVYPPEVEFAGIEEGVLYVLTISVQNISKDARRFRIVPPATQHFVLNHVPSGSIASGLDIKCEVEFQMTEARDYHDKILILSGDERVELPLRALIPAPRFEFDSFANMGSVIAGSTTTRVVELTNVGYAAGTFSLTPPEPLADGSTITLSPTTGTLIPRSQEGQVPPRGEDEDSDDDDEEERARRLAAAGSSSARVTVTLEAKSAGSVRELLPLALSGQPDRTIDVAATVVDQKLELVMPDGDGAELSAVPFGPLHYGEKRRVTAQLANNGPVPISFTIVHADAAPQVGSGSEGGGGSDNESESSSMPPPSVSSNTAEEVFAGALVVKPEEGVLQPYSQLAVTFDFKPVLPPIDKGFGFKGPADEYDGHDFSLHMVLNSSETGQSIPVEVSGRGVVPRVQVSQRQFKFGECAVHERRDILLEVKNAGALPVTYSLNKVANFSAKPSRGLLQPGQLQKTVVSFAPGQMGQFKNGLQLVVNDGLQIIPLRVSGTSNTAARKQLLPRGPAAVKEDFKPRFNFVRNEDAQRAPKSTYHQRKAWENPAIGGEAGVPDGEEWRASGETHITYSLSEMKYRAAQKASSNDFLRTSRLKREGKEVKAEDEFRLTLAKRPVDRNDPEGRELGMMGATEGLPSPRIPLPAADEPLWLERPMEGMEAMAGKRPGRMHDENKLIKKKFKPRPTTQAEMRDCSMFLDPDDLGCVSAGPRVLNFGEVCVNSTNAKSFFVTNDLAQAVLAEVNFGGFSELQDSTPLSQVVPVAATAGFDVYFKPLETGPFQRTVSYQINEKHTFKFTIQAEVVPISVTLSRSEVRFHFKAGSADFGASEPLTITNPGNAIANFSWTVGGGAFSVLPEAGQLQPGEATEVMVNYAPAYGARPEEPLGLVVESGNDEELKCFGVAEDVKCAFADKKVDFGTLAVGLPEERTVRLKSVGKDTAVFQIVEPPAGSGITVVPTSGCIPAGESVKLKVRLTPPTARAYGELNLEAMVRNGRVAKLPLEADAVVPDVGITQEEFNFEQLTVGGVSRQLLTLDNKGSISALIHMDLASFPEFSVELPDELLDMEGSDEIMYPMGNEGETEEQAKATMRRMSMQMAERQEANEDGDGGGSGSDDEEEAITRWCIKAPPEKELSFYLVYTPTAIKKQHFQLPIKLVGVKECAGLKRAVIAEGLKPRLIVGKTIIDFHHRVVSRDAIKKIPYSMEVPFSNDDPQPLSWEMDVSGLVPADEKAGGALFHVSPTSGELAPDEEASVRFTFLPDKDRDFDAVVPLYINGQKDRPYLMLTLKGTGMYPHLKFDRPAVHLPVVPLGVTSKMTFYVKNIGYDMLDFRHRTNPTWPVTVKFPEGESVGIAKMRLPVEVSFVSKKAMACTTKIDFFDEEENRFAIEVTAATDNCLLSNMPFYGSHVPEHFDFFKKEGHSMQLLSVGQLAEIQKAAENAKLPTRKPRRNRRTESKTVEPEPERKRSADMAATGCSALEKLPGIDDGAVDRLLRWLNATWTKTQINVLPADVTDLDGVPVIEVVEAMCGKKVKDRVKKFSDAPKEKAKQLHDFYGSFCTFLKTQGALLDGVTAALLLSCDDFVRIGEVAHLAEQEESGVKHRETPAMRLHRRFVLEHDWEKGAKNAWCTVLLQAIKLFSLARVSEKRLVDLPGMPPPEEPEDDHRRGHGRAAAAVEKGPSGDPMLNGSNIYSHSENTLLKWMSYHYNQANTAGAPAPLTNFDDALRDGAVLCSLLVAHVPSLENAGRPLEGYFRQCTTTEQEEANAVKFVTAMDDMGLAYCLTPAEVTNLDARDGLLLALYLFQNLPQYMPKTTIVFSGALGKPIRKDIELRNPSKKKITFLVSLEGDTDFRLESTSVDLPPKGSTKFPIELVARFSKVVEGQLTFRSQRTGGVAAATMVFLLKSDIRSRNPTRTLQIEAATYSRAPLEVEVANPFDKDCHLHISLSQDVPAVLVPGKAAAAAAPAAAAGGGKKHGHGHGHGHGKKEHHSHGPSKHMLPFFCGKHSCKIKKGGSAKVPVDFLAFGEGQFKAQLVFLDEAVGEFLYDLVGAATLPEPLDTLAFKCEASDGRIDRDLTLPVKNARREAAMRDALERLHGAHKTKAEKELAEELAKPLGTRNFKLELNSPYFTSPQRELMLIDELDTTTPKHGVSRADKEAAAAAANNATLQTPRGNSGGKNMLSVSFQPRAAGTYPNKLVLRPNVEGGGAGADDVRVYALEATVSAATAKSNLDFTCAARQAITQVLPITNGSDSDWTLQAVLKSPGKLFKGATTLKVPARSTENYTVTFAPKWLCEETAELTLKNAATDDLFEYELHGVGEAPLAEAHVALSCQARAKLTHRFAVKNARKEATTFAVESDVPHVSGESALEVLAGSTAEYELSIAPQLGGTYTGSITFLEPNGEYQWYTCEVTASSPDPEQALDISSAVREAVSVEVSLTNPLAETVEFDVALRGAGLLGEPFFALGPNQSGTYELLYSPLVAGVHEGSVSFSNAKLGEFWYKLNLTADPAPPTVLEPISCAVGLTCSTPIMLENPTGEAVILTSKVDNRRNFCVAPSMVSLGAFAQQEVDLQYTPSSMGEVEAGEVIFVHPKLGEWVYKATGSGEEPGLMPPVNVFSSIGQTQSSSFVFRNPFGQPLSIEIHLLAESAEIAGLFKLLLKRPQVNVQPYGHMQIPISFSPELITEQHATVEIVSFSVADRGKLQWTFPIHGIAEAAAHDQVFHFSCKSRGSLEQTLEVVLPGLGELAGPESFTHELAVPEDYRALVTNSFSVRPTTDRIDDAAHPLRFEIAFNPLRPFACGADLLVKKASGGQWRFELNIEATEPEVDDVIEIHAPLHETTSVSFKLSNEFMDVAPFVADFTSASSSEFSVFPKSGDLEPYGREGTNFVVSFKPTEYGKTQIGRLHITTEEMMWSYEIRGTHLDYIAPSDVKPVVDSRLDPGMEARLGRGVHKNFLKANLKPTAPKVSGRR